MYWASQTVMTSLRRCRCSPSLESGISILKVSSKVQKFDLFANLQTERRNFWDSGNARFGSGKNWGWMRSWIASSIELFTGCHLESQGSLSFGTWKFQNRLQSSFEDLRQFAKFQLLHFARFCVFLVCFLIQVSSLVSF